MSSCIPCYKAVDVQQPCYKAAVMYNSLVTRLLRLYYLVVAMLQGEISLVTRLSFLYGQSAILPTVALHMLIKYVYMLIWVRVLGTIVLFHLPYSWKYWRGFNFGELVILTVYTAKLNSCQN